MYFSKRSHDTLFPVSGPLFQETKAEDGSGKYLYLIDPQSYAVSRIGPYAGMDARRARSVAEQQRERSARLCIEHARSDAPVLAERVSMPNKNSDDATEIFDAHTHKSLGLIGSSEDMIEIDFVDGKVSRVGDQDGIGRVVRTSN